MEGGISSLQIGDGDPFDREVVAERFCTLNNMVKTLRPAFEMLKKIIVSSYLNSFNILSFFSQVPNIWSV